MGFEQPPWTEHKRMSSWAKGRSLWIAPWDTMVWETYWCPYFLNFKSRRMSQCVWGKFMGTMGLLIWCWVTRSVSLVTIFVELICSIRTSLDRLFFLLSPEWLCVFYVCFILSTFSQKTSGARYLFLPYFISFHSYQTHPPRPLPYLLQKWPFYLTCHPWHFIIHFKNGKVSLLSKLPFPWKYH